MFSSYTIPQQAVGSKGSDVYTTTGDPRVDLATSLVRGLDSRSICDGLNRILEMDSKEAFEDAFVMAFQTRNIRGGKGERDLGLTMFAHLLLVEPELMRESMLDLIPHFGCWRDLFVLSMGSSVLDRNRIWNITAKQLLKDQETPEGKPISLCAKWAPREDKKSDQAKFIARVLFPEVTKMSDSLKSYRKLVAGLNRRLDTTEIKMCAGDWEMIEPAKVPGRNLHIHRRAFLNEVAPKKKGEEVISGEIRHPDDEVRMACREHFQEFFAKAVEGKVKLNGAETVYPHEVILKVQQSLRDKSASVDEKILLIGQWREFVWKAREAGALKNCLAMCDFSGSMTGLPKLICTALGLLVAEVNGMNKILTFDSTPKWHQFPEGDIFDKMNSIDNSLGQGTSTDFQKAMDMILADIKTRRLHPEELPKDLIVFTDMGWDEASCSSATGTYTGNVYRHHVKTKPWQTHIQMIRESFRRAGEDMWGVPFVAPRIVIWNLRADSKDCHATADEKGVVLLSGWSPSLFKVLQEKGVQISTPLQALRAVLDDPMYDIIRQRVRAWND